MEPEIGLIDLEGTDTNMDSVVDIATEPKVVIPERIAQERAVKAHLSMGDLSPGVDSIRSSIQRGDEQYAREDSAASLQLKERDNRLRMLQQVAGSRTPGSPVSQDELDLVAGLSIEPTIDPRTVWEKQYGTFITNELVMVNDKPDGAVNQAITENPQQTFKDLDLARDHITKNESLKRIAEEGQARLKDAGFLETFGTYVEQIIPFKSALNIANESIFTMTQLPGTSMEEKIANLWAIPSPEAFNATVEREFNRIAESNILDAIKFVNAVISYSKSDAVLDNIFGALDIADVTTLGGALAKGVRGALRGSATAVAPKVSRPTSEARKAIQDAVKATIGVQHPEKIASALGDTSRAALMKATQKVQSEATEVVSDTATDRIRGLMNTMPTMTRSMQIFDGSASLSNEAAARISIALENNAQKYVDAVASTITPERLTPQALNQAVENAKADLTRQFNHLNDTVIDLVRNPRDPFTNTDSVSIRLGKPDASTFWSRNNAELYAKDIYQLPEGSYTIGQQGTSFFIDVAKNVDETADSVRNLLVTTDNKTSIPNLAQFLFQGIRTPAETLSALQKANRDAALFGNTNFTQIISEGTKVIGSLGKAEKRDLNRIMEINRDFWDPVSNTRGQYYETASALEQAYVKNIGRLPTEREVEAYYTAVQVNELDLMVRNAVAYRDKARAGIENFQFKATYEGYSEYEPAKFRPSPKFEGKQVDYVPWNSDHLSVLVVDPAAPAPKLIARNAPGEDKALVDQLVKEQGYTIIQVANPAGRPLKSLTNSAEPVQYVVTKDFNRLPLEYQQVGRTPGFHVEIAHGFYTKQPRVYTSAGGVRNYEGDITAFSFSTQAQADKFTKRMETARQMLKAGDETGLERYLAKNLPYSKESFKELFAPKDGYFDIEQPFVTVTKGKKTIDSIENSLRGNGPFRDLSKSEYNLLDDVDRKFQGERSAMFRTIDELGTEENPVFKFRDAPMIDPLSTTSRALGQAARSRYFGDMKTSAAEQFVKEFADVLDIPADELTKYPSYYLYNPVWKSGANQQELAAAKATQKAALELMGTKTPFGEQLDWMRAKIMNGVYRFGGQNTADLVDNNKLLQSRDPLSFFRGMAFHSKLGLFNPVQLFVQSQGLAHVLAIAPREAGPAVGGYALMRYAMVSGKDEIIKGAASKARFLGWKPEQFEESLSLMQRTGFLNVGRESTFIDDMSDPKLYQSTFGKFLDKGAVFFKETERMVRMSAWNAAYLQFKKNNPTGVIGNRELGEILARADTLTVNMTNASKASWERGIFSIPAQFQSYNVRMFEQLTGTQLTAQEKMRAFGLYTALYGVPVAASAATLYPWYEDIRGAAIELGYNVDNRFMDGIIEGIPSAMLSAVFGKDFNIAQRYGPGGFSVLKDALNGDKDFLELFLGPAGSVTKDILNTVVPAAGAIGKMMTGEDYTPEVTDLIDAARTISSVNSAHRVYAAMTVGKYISRKGMHLTDSTTPEAITAAITGLQPREFTDAMIMNRSMKDIKEYQNEVGKEFQKYLNRALIEAQQGNYEAADAYMKKANAYKELGDYQPNQLNDLMKQSFNSQNISLMERIKRDWIMRSPASKQQERIQRSIKQNPAPNIEGTNQ